MAIDISQNPGNLKYNVRLKAWRDLIIVKCSELGTKIRPWFSRYWKGLIAIVVAYLLIYCALTDCSKETEDDMEKKDVSTSIASMEPLLEIEQKLVQALDSYANELQEKVNEIRSGIAKMRRPNEIENIDAEKFLGNPFNSFPMLRRLKTEWKVWEMYIRKPIGKDQIKLIHQTIETIIDFDILLSVQCIEFLRDIYNMPPSDWVEGKLFRKKLDEKFSALDAYSVAILLFVKENYKAADEWFMAAVDKFEHLEIYPILGFNRSLIMESFADNYLKQNRTDEALTLIKTALKNDPNNPKLMEKQAQIEQLNLTVIETETANVTENEDFPSQATIRRLCQGDYIVNDSVQLFCYYNSSVNDFVRLAPFKVEEVALDPIVLLYHDIVNDDEIMEIKNIGRKDLTRSGTIESKYSTHRTSKNSWIDSKEHAIGFHIDQRIEDMLGLKIGKEELLIGNYGLGGYYKTHKDCLLICDDDNKLDCDKRAISVLIYMSNVERGGDTIFPYLGVGVAPQKGTALIWYNLQNDMATCNLRTTHMACPVVLGSKWFAIKWVRANRQTFRKPCYRNITNTYGLEEQCN